MLPRPYCYTIRPSLRWMLIPSFACQLRWILSTHRRGTRTALRCMRCRDAPSCSQVRRCSYSAPREVSAQPQSSWASSWALPSSRRHLQRHFFCCDPSLSESIVPSLFVRVVVATTNVAASAEAPCCVAAACTGAACERSLFRSTETFLQTSLQPRQHSMTVDLLNDERSLSKAALSRAFASCPSPSQTRNL